MILSAVLRVRLDVVLSKSDQKSECGGHDGGSSHRPVCGRGTGSVLGHRHPVQRHYHPGTRLALSLYISVLWDKAHHDTQLRSLYVFLNALTLLREVSTKSG